MSDAVLEIAGLTISYGQVRAVSDIHLSVLSGRITTLIGSNGAGKTTIMKGVTGLKRVASGGVRFRGEQLIGRQVDAIVAAGVSLVPEGRRLFPTMSVRENLEIGAYRRSDRLPSGQISIVCWTTFPRCASGSMHAPWRFPAASSRWSRSVAR